MTPKIAIIGAGPAGLTLASILYRNGITSTVFESDESPSARPQGGSLDLHPQTGQAALDACGLTPQFKKYARYDGQDLVLSDKHHNRLIQLKDTETGKPEIDRTQLRKILLDSLPEGVVRWNEHLVSATEETLTFKTHVESGFDLIVGADGAWSKIRPLCCYVTPFYAGITGIELVLNETSSKHSEISALVGNGSVFAMASDDGRGLSFQRNDNDTIKCYAWSRRPEHWVKDGGLNWENRAEVCAVLKKDFGDWSPELTRIIDECDNTPTPRPLYMLPVGIRWPSQKKVTIIGDAAHLMTPFAGEGVNMAMADGMDLAEAIIAQPDNIAAAIREMEPKMCERATGAAGIAWENTMLRFEPGGLKRTEDRFKRLFQKTQGKAGDDTH
ncbi:putative salicylate hydroxylase [Talaromyces proteolyticus]|uniref:Salicylate hydroxylase n=1 Tax=Talaromyces proteolyticus TaxID=1131652 RepID=A0AAD4KIA2_9EURO|nr:putative salicylate hydroxylase [Talaromyces proteolyticus]KAH8690005.1 putative salicylate hydroxylase [Talaromyces proteolyticus]